MAHQDNKEDNVFLFYPNLIGYGRVVLAMVAFLPILYCPRFSAVCYFLSAFLDAFDGHLARMYNQSTRFGAMLDQLTDRCVFLGLLMTLCHLYPNLMFFLQLVAIIDVASHWMHLHAADLTGQKTHKQSKNLILHYYYTSKPFLFFMCFANEAFYGLLYLNYFGVGPRLLNISLFTVLCVLMCPFALGKSVISMVHLIEASRDVVRHDVVQRVKQTN